MTGFEGGEPEKRYRQLQSDYENADSRVTAAHKRVRDVQTVAGDLFSEWEKENQQIEMAELRQISRKLNRFRPISTKFRIKIATVSDKDFDKVSDEVTDKVWRPLK